MRRIDQVVRTGSKAPLSQDAASERATFSLRQVQYFLAVAKSRSFSAAARLAHVSQPSLHAQIGQLEQQLGAALLTRHARGVELTAAGKAFLPHASAALEEIKRAKQAVAALHKTQASLGVTPTAGRAIVADLLRLHRENSHAPKILVRDGMSDELWKLVVDANLDASICYEPDAAPSLNVFPLFREDLFLVGTRAALGAVDRVVNRTMLGSFPLVLGYPHHRTRRLIETAMHEAGSDLRTFEEVDSTSLKRELLVRHAKCSIVPYGLFLDDIKAGVLTARVIEPRLTRTGALILDQGLPAAVRQFLLTSVRSIVKRRIAEKEYGWRSA
jgi:LysR family transcriptional regulator, nitrogen assimilation regulatory protein